MRNNNIGNLKYYILGALFIVTVIVTFVSMNYEASSASSTSMTEASLPIITMKTENGVQFNRLHGYTCSVDEFLSSSCITPLPSDKKLPISIYTYGQEVTSISYKIRDIDDQSLIENTTVTDYTIDGNQISAQLNIKNLIEDDTEYMLQIILSTEDNESISYYTKIITGDDYDVDEKLGFVLDFNSATLSTDNIGTITSYLESSSSSSSTNYGEVNINSTQTMIGWGSLEPFIQSEIVPTITEIDSELAIITMDYTIGAANDYDSYDTYNVDEYYRIRQTDTQTYLLNFERNTNQVFDAKNDLTSSSEILLGITSDTDVEFEESPEQQYLYFINEGSLWCFDTSSVEFTKVFSFISDDSDNIRESYQMHDIKIIDVTDDGDCLFLVDGYMNRGLHEGEVGVSLYSYDYETNTVEENSYIPLDVPYEMVVDNVGGITYIKDSNIFYILIDDTLYAVDMTSKEIMTEITDLTYGTYATAPSASAIAYSTNGELYNTDTIRLFDVEQSNDYLIKADEGDSLRVIGYINDDFVYGVAHNSDITTDENGNTVFAMYKVCIINSSYELVKEYSEDGIYISEASITNLRINLSRVVKDDDGDYESISVDQLINKDENASDSNSYISTTTSDTRLQETVIALSTTLSNVSTVSVRNVDEVAYNANNEININKSLIGSGRYYVYGYGVFQGSYISVSDAINAAYDTYGYVVDSDSNVIWKRYKDSSASISSITAVTSSDSSLKNAVDTLLKYDGHQIDNTSELSSDYTALDLLNEYTEQHALGLSGITLEKALYYVSAGVPVIGKTGTDTYVVITAYDSSNVTYINMSTGASETKTLTAMTTTFTQWGNIFITYY